MTTKAELKRQIRRLASLSAMGPLFRDQLNIGIGEMSAMIDHLPEEGARHELRDLRERADES
jgi:hypothetical protein